jgi:hypothetical protein
MKSSIFLDIMLCSPLKVRFGGIYRLQLQGRIIRQVRNQSEEGSRQKSSSYISSCFSFKEVNGKLNILCADFHIAYFILCRITDLSRNALLLTPFVFRTRYLV